MAQTSSETGRDNRWIVFSYFTNIDGKAASQHIDDRLPPLMELGVRPLLVSSLCSPPSPLAPNLRAPSAAPSGMRFELRYLRKRNNFFKYAHVPILFFLLPFYAIEKLVCNLDSQWSWFPFAFLRGLGSCRGFMPDLIYSTGGPPSAHVAAGMLAAARKIPWIAELQDPLVLDSRGWARSRAMEKFSRRLESFILDRASAVVFLTEGARSSALKRTGANPSKVHVIYPGAPANPEPAPKKTRGEFCRFAHLGSLGGSRNLETLLDAMQALFSSRPEFKEIVRIDLYGTMDRLSAEIVSRFPHPGIVTDFGKVSRREAVRAMRESDVLALIQNQGQSAMESIPSKVYEYLQTGRPIMGLVYRNPHLKNILIQGGHYAAEVDRVDDIRETVEQVLSAWQAGTLSPPRPPSRYTSPAAAQSLAEIARTVM
ncbi:MAG: glycosyltransferase [Desulfobacteraceae bacterium]|nr:glycosyltransferase [Desulfobacteraceae bacterium]